jgi:putative PIN family toxin of toxin-antitoxin system
MIKVILDTNILVSLLIGKEFRKYQNFIFDNENLLIVISSELLNEFLDVVNRPKLQKYFSKELVEVFLNKLINCSELVNINTKVEICRDIKDNFLLSLAVDGEADFLISSDSDLLILESFGTTQITTLVDFYNLQTINS